MPKETIYDENKHTCLEVRWSPDQYVQVATLSNNPKEFVEWCRNLVQGYDIEAAKLKGKDQFVDPRKLEMPHVSDPTQLLTVASLGMFWTPGRDELNRLIRVVRRARNAAFGADE